MVIVNDFLGNEINVTDNPEKIISLVPSITELLFDLELDGKIVGVTNYCVHPLSKTKEVVKIGSPKQIDVETIKEIQPDLIFASKEENSKADITYFLGNGNIFVSDVKSFEESLSMIYEIGQLTGKDKEAQKKIKKIHSKLKGFPVLSKPKKIAYLIWEEPFMTINNDTYIHSILELCGFENVFAEQKARYPEITENDLMNSDAEYIFLSTEPYPFTKKHAKRFNKNFNRKKSLVVDGEIFSWYGTRILKLPKYMEKLMMRMEEWV